MKKFSPENNITVYIIGISLILIIVLGVVISYFRSVSESIHKQNTDNQQYLELALISEDFISEVLESQQLFNEYIYSLEKNYVNKYKSSVSKMDSIIEMTRKQEQLQKETEIFQQVMTLLEEQYNLVPRIKKRLYAENPVEKVAQDSLFTKDLDLAVGRASLSYDINIRSLRYEISNVMSLNNVISEKISKLLLDIFKTTSQRSKASMDNALHLAELNNRYSLLIGIGTIILIIILSLNIFINIYRIKRSKRELEKANTEKEEIMESRHRLLLSVAHDIKTPMSSIKAYLSSDNISSEEKEIIKSSTSHVLALMDNLVDFSSMQKGQIQANIGNFNLRDLLDSSIDMFNSLAIQKGIDLIKDYHKDCNLRVKSDALKIKQIIINLISNAFKYTIDGFVRITADYEKMDGNGTLMLKLTVEDTGVGISKEQIDKIFKPYYRSEENKHLSGGTGLGLYVVDGLTRLLNGKLEMESERGKGTSVHLSLPLDQCTPVSSPDSPKRILVIEDDPAFRTVAKMLLSRLSHEVTATSSIVHGDFDYVLSDLNLPGITRKEILDAYKGIPVVLMTGDTSFSKQDAVSEGFRTIIYKPFSVDDVKEIFGGIPLENDSIIMLGDDSAEMNKVVDTFIKSLPSYLEGLQEALDKNDIFKARFVSHKMLPMFIMFRSGEMIPILNRLNAVDNEGIKKYPNWKHDVEILIKMIHRQYF